MSRTYHWTKLPENLGYLAAPAEKYGHLQFENKIHDFCQNITKEQVQELRPLLERVVNDGEAIELWLDRYDMVIHVEARRVYFLMELLTTGNELGALGEKVQGPPWNTVENHIKSLGKFGSFRLASERMWAARHLPGLGEDARQAIPALRQALADEDYRVRVWAHYALAVLEGDGERHAQAVREIYAEHDQRDNLGCHDDVGGEAAEALERFAERRGS